MGNENSTTSKKQTDRIFQLCTNNKSVIETLPLIIHTDIRLYNRLYGFTQYYDALSELYERDERIAGNELFCYVQNKDIKQYLTKYLLENTETLNKTEVLCRKEMVIVCDWMQAMYDKYPDEINNWHFVYKMSFFKPFEFYFDDRYKSIVTFCETPPIAELVAVVKEQIPKISSIIEKPYVVKSKSMEIESSATANETHNPVYLETDLLIFKDKIQ